MVLDFGINPLLFMNLSCTINAFSSDNCEYINCNYDLTTFLLLVMIELVGRYGYRNQQNYLVMQIGVYESDGCFDVDNV